MANGSGVFRGDRNRNAGLGRLRELVRLENTIVGIDLATRSRWWWCATTTPKCWRAGRSATGCGISGSRWIGRPSGPR
jgi:hypothetical protein